MLHGLTDQRCVTLGNGFFQGIRGIKHRLVVRRQSLGLHRAFLGFALKSFVKRLTECVPEFLSQLAVECNGLRFGLPTLLQGLDRVYAQARRCRQLFGLFDHGATPGNAGVLRLFKFRMRG